MFDEKSRYAKTELYQAPDHRGRRVPVVATPDAPREVSIGLHLLRQGQRLDHLAYRYLGDPAGYWRICELNNVMLPEALTEAQEIAIPRKRR